MYTNTTEVNGQLFDDTTEVLLDLIAKSQNGRMRDMYDLALKAVEYYREYLDNNQPFDSTTNNFSSRLTNRATYVHKCRGVVVSKGGSEQKFRSLNRACCELGLQPETVRRGLLQRSPYTTKSGYTFHYEGI